MPSSARRRYALETTLSGDVITADGASEQGMVMDFAEVGAITQDHLVDAWDHAFLAWRRDQRVVEFLATLIAGRMRQETKLEG